MAIANEVIDAIQLSANYPSILKMGVFGSYARGEQNQDSDVDILYDYDESMVDDMLDCVDAICDRIGRKVDFVAHHALFKSNMDSYDLSFQNRVLSEVVWVYEKN